MSLTFGLSSFRDLLAKLERDAQKLKSEEVNSDYFFNFVVTGYSLIDWVKHDPTVPASAKQSVQTLYADRWIKICGDLANASKHFSLTSRTPLVASTDVESGYGVGRYGMGGWGVGEQSIEITLSDGSTFDCLRLVDDVLTTWHTFTATHSI